MTAITTDSNDPITGTFSRRGLCRAAERDFKRSTRLGTDLSCAVIDLDNFKRINDICGYGAADAVLRQVAAVCREELRVSDYIGRTGGQEFTVIFGGTALGTAIGIAERLRGAIENMAVEFGGKMIRISASIGVAQRADRDRTAQDLMQSAESAMYLAKSFGRNRTMCSPGAEMDACNNGAEANASKLGERAEGAKTGGCKANLSPRHLDYMENARKCFAYVKSSANEKTRALFADIGLDYLRLAHEQAAVFAADESFDDTAGRVLARMTHL
ncbi:MAG TPA: GGDEF domain-containing protein [Pseudorhodoplanes sp.]|nr:GGDEF domain-containing protein [Pseudorhodoplanes sp.]